MSLVPNRGTFRGVSINLTFRALDAQLYALDQRDDCLVCRTHSRSTCPSELCTNNTKPFRANTDTQQSRGAYTRLDSTLVKEPGTYCRASESNVSVAAGRISMSWLAEVFSGW